MLDRRIFGIDRLGFKQQFISPVIFFVAQVEERKVAQQLHIILVKLQRYLQIGFRQFLVTQFNSTDRQFVIDVGIGFTQLQALEERRLCGGKVT